MEEKDLKQIKEVVREEIKTSIDGMAQIVAKGFGDVDKKFQGVDRKFQEVDKRLQGIDQRFQKIDEKFEDMDSKISALPTKSYFDDKFADISGDLITKLRKEDQKVNRLLEILKQKKLLSESDIQELARLQIFPKQT